MARLTLTFLGSLQAALDGVPIARFRSDKVRALLAYLALETERPHTRASLCGLLWPDQPDDAALHNLSQTLLRLREALGDTRGTASFLHISRQSVQWNTTSDYRLDAADFTRLAAHDAAADLEQAVALYRGELLPSFSLPGCAGFEEWLLLLRERFAHQAVTALDALTRAQLAEGRYQAAAQQARRQLELDPWREEAHRQLMRALAGAGDRAAALTAYVRCRQLLLDQLGVEPDAATHALYEQIRTNEWKMENGKWKKEHPAEPPLSIVNSQFSISEWSEAPEPGRVYGRAPELAQLRRWLLDERCQLVALLGIGGVGKTTLAATLAHDVAGQFTHVIWRSLLNAPPLDELLPSIVQTLSGSPLPALPVSLDEQLALLLDQLRRQRCLLVLDNLESVLQTDGLGQMRAGYQGYAQLLDQLAHRRHASCVLLTSRERPRGLAGWEAELAVVRTLRLDGLDAVAGQAMLHARGLTGQGEEARELVARYSGHPLALQLVAQTVQELFGGAIGAFLRTEAPIFDDIRAVLDQQFAHLSPLEQEILFWLAIEREPISAATLRANLVQHETSRTFLEALRALQHRSLLETVGDGFTLQNVLIEYMTERLIAGVCAELLDGEWATRRVGDKESGRQGEWGTGSVNLAFSRSPVLPHSLSGLNRFALFKAQAREYVRQSQMRLILEPIADQLVAKLGKERLAARAQSMLADLRADAPLAPGYAGGNLLNLLLHLKIDISGYDFSRLNVWQADLRGVTLAGVNFSEADLSGCAFTLTFNCIQPRWAHAGQQQF